jgi:hypothetical protein
VKRIQMEEPKAVKDRAYGPLPLDLRNPDVLRAHERRT